VDYVLATHDPANAGDVDRDATTEWARQAQWDRLEIRDTRAGAAGDDEGEVEFVAHYRLKGAECRHHERSRFRRVDGRWYYLDGDMVKARPVVREQPKVGRNDPCPCGSARKYKRCCAG